MFEVAVNMKSFCNNYYRFYYSGNLGQALKLIRTKALATSISFQVPIPGRPKHKFDFQGMFQNDIKKGLGISHFKIGH
jgi:hypothetical protein